MISLRKALKAREKEENPVKCAIVGTGQMGTGIVEVMETMDGMKPVFVADLDISKAKSAYLNAGVAEALIKECDDPYQADQLINNGFYVVTRDGTVSTACSNVDVVVEATGIPEVGANIALKTILAKKHIVMMTVEGDVVIGPILKVLADNSGVVYTGVCGDEPAATLELVEFCRNVGLEVICAGKGKNTPLHVDANPDNLYKLFPKAKNLVAGNPKMFVEFVDGSKTAIEMAALSNATGLIPDVRGMHGPRSDVDGLNKVFRLEKDGGILSAPGRVDYAIGVAPGVFAIARPKKKGYANLRDQEYLTFYRPYHLPALEASLSAAKAELFNEASIAPERNLVSETIAVAKKDLIKGEKIDGIGGFTIYGSIETAEKAREEKLLPLGLAATAVMKKDVSIGSTLTYDDVDLDQSSMIFALRKMQDNLI